MDLSQLFAMDWKHAAVFVAGAAAMWAAAYVRSGRPPLIDPGNKMPAIDMIRDTMRKALEDYHGPKDGADVLPFDPFHDDPKAG